MKYRLIKTYPGSPELNTICEYNNNPWSDSNSFTNPVLKPKDYPEFWELVVEKNYEILSVITSNNKFIEKVYNQNATIKPFWKIHSIKRLSDGEIFTVGDKLDCKGWFGNITRFVIINNELKIFQQQHINSSKYKPLLIQELIKFKQPLFTTEDDVNIFEGDDVYWININTFKKVNCNKYNDDLGEISIKSLLSKKYECKAVGFSTKEKAEEYILMNKPCLSINDVININTNGMNKTISFKKEIQNLVKSKI
jgi:hypothetical protein